MTLPAIQPLCGDKAGLQLRHHAARRRPVCLSAAWADPPTTRRERRRAICSWSVGYGALQELEEATAAAVGTLAAGKESLTTYKKGKVAEHAALLVETPPARGRVINGAVLVPTHANVSAGAPPTSTQHQRHASRPAVRHEPISGMPGLWSGLFNRGRRNSGGGAAPLVNKNGAAAVIRPAASVASLKKCETVLALTGVLRSSSSSSSIEPLHPVNRLRVSPHEQSHSRMCSRCSSLLTLASGSRYSLNSTKGFVPVASLESMIKLPPVLCKLCLAEVPPDKVVHITQCECAFCEECMKAYVEFEINEGAYDISCPDAQCPSQGVLEQDEIKRLVGTEQLEKHKKYRLNREVELDKNRTWCPRAGCETVCSLCPSKPCAPQSVFCPTCSTDFCSNCKKEWHQGLTCDEYMKQLAKEGKVEDAGIPFDSDLIKCCPMCNVPIEKDEGCAQMMCKRCKHVFCWYCLASLDDDFLLRHYDKGPCKNKLGHSRASVIWHRTQVIGIFAGFGILLLVASPLLLLAAPCIVCCKCRICDAGNTKLDNEDDVPVDES